MPELRGPVLALPPRQRRLVYAAIGVVAVSGLAWLLAPGPSAGDGFEAGGGEAWRHASLVVHGVSAYLLLLVVGSIWPLHMRLAWRHRRNRFSGIAMGSTLAWLALSGLWLYYAVSGRETVAVLHWAVGLALVPLLVWHIVRGRRSRHR